MVHTRAKTSGSRLTRQQANRFKGVARKIVTLKEGEEGDGLVDYEAQDAATILLEVKNHSRFNKSEKACARLVALIQGRQA